MAIENP
jgi:hypothetical protein